MADHQYLVRCECGYHTVAVDIYVDVDHEGYISFGTITPHDTSWRERFRIIWDLLRGRGAHLSEVILSPKQLEELRDVLVTATTREGN